MRTVLLLTLLSFGNLDGFAALKIQERIGFEPNSAVIGMQSLELIDSLIGYFDEYEVEKIDIVGHCTTDGDDAYNLSLSRKRSLAVFNYMTQFYPDLGVYEIRYFGEQYSPVLFGRDKGRCVQITAYLLERNVKVDTDNVALALFPEESEWIGMSQREIEEIPQELVSDRPDFTFIPTTFSPRNSFKIEAIHFYGNSALYKNESDPSLHELVDFMNHYQDIKIILEGHVNGKMGRAYLKRAGKSNPEHKIYKNAKELSLARAETIKEFLVFEGIDPDRITCVGKGGTEMIYPKPKNNKQHEANRRIEVIIVNE